MLFFYVSKGIREFAKAMIENPLDWKQDLYNFTHIHRKELSIWTANGVLFIAIGGNSCLSLAEKFYITFAIKKTLAKQLQEHVKIKRDDYVCKKE